MSTIKGQKLFDNAKFLFRFICELCNSNFIRNCFVSDENFESKTKREN
jgi:hypothetical protein